MTYSYTQISQYLRCPRSYRYRYLDGWKEKEDRAALLFGRCLVVGGAVGKVMSSKHPKFQVGDIVEGYWGWQEFTVSQGQGLRKLDSSLAPVSTALGVLEMPCMTAYFGFL